jgi:hypothetical protein
MIPVEITPGMWGRQEMKENGGGDECIYDILGTL